jgi:hypothetical protein
MAFKHVARYTNRIFVFDNENLIAPGKSFCDINGVIVASLIDALFGLAGHANESADDTCEEKESSSRDNSPGKFFLAHHVTRINRNESLLLKMESLVGRSRAESRKLDKSPIAIFRGRDSYLKGGLVEIDSVIGRCDGKKERTVIHELQETHSIAPHGSLTMVYEDNTEVWEMFSRHTGSIEAVIRGLPVERQEWVMDACFAVQDALQPSHNHRQDSRLTRRKLKNFL